MPSARDSAIAARASAIPRVRATWEASLLQPFSAAATFARKADARPVRGAQWVARTTLAAPPENDVQQAVLRALREWQDPRDAGDDAWMTACGVQAVYAEWMCARPGVGAKDPEPEGVGEREKFESMASEVPEGEGVVVLYFHGGGFVYVLFLFFLFSLLDVFAGKVVASV